MDAIGGFLHDILMIIVLCFAILVVIGLAVASLSASNKERLKEIRERKQAEYDAANAEYEKACAELCEPALSGWSLIEKVTVDSRPARIALSEDGKSLRFLSWKRQGNGIVNVTDRTYPTKAVIGLAIDQPDVSRIVTHKEKTPVAVNVRRSAGGRALVGGIVAGPAGAVIGGASGLNGKTKITMVETERHETVDSKGHPTLIVQLDDLASPRRALVFSDVKTTNEWSSRIHAAMTRARS